MRVRGREVGGKEEGRRCHGIGYIIGQQMLCKTA